MNKKIHAIFLSLLLPVTTWAAAQVTPKNTDTPLPQLLYASLGERLLGYRVDPNNATLTFLGEVSAPTNVQFAIKNGNGDVLYVVSSNAGSGTLGAKGDQHVLTTYRIDTTSGALTSIGAAIALPERPIHISLNRGGTFVAIAYNQSATVSIHPLGSDGSAGQAVTQQQSPEAGIFTHQVTFASSDRFIIALARGNEAVGDVPNQPGSINTFAIDQSGALSKVKVEPIDPSVGPRHLAYHPKKPLALVAMERGSKLYVYPLDENGTLADEPTYRKETLKNLKHVESFRQRGGVIQITPDGRHAYLANRADATVEHQGKQVLSAGENNIAVFSIDTQTGEPRRIQIIDSHGVEGRTMKVDPTGKLLIVANQKTVWVNKEAGLKKVRANLAVFRIGADGRLSFVRSYEMDDEKKSLLWMDI